MRRTWPLLLLALVAAGAAPAGLGGAGSDSEPAWSPDGRWIAFVHDAGSGGNTSDLVLVTPNGREQRLVVRGTELDSHLPYEPQWSPDGRTLLFGTCCDPDRVYTFALEGSRLTRIATVGREPTWSPEGAKVAFVGERSYLVTANADGSDARRLTPDVSHPDWSPDGRRIAYTSGGDLWVWLLAEARAVRLTETRGREDFARWSPDGALIAFTRGPAYYVMRADGTRERRVARTWPGDPSSSPGPAAWSPNGRWLALVARAPVPRPVGLVTDAVSVVRPGGGGFRRVAPQSNSSQTHPTWAPDGKSLAFHGAPPCPTVREGIAIVKLTRRRLFWATQSCFIYGTARADRLSGTPDGDVIYGLAGDDAIFAGPGEDVLHGGRGDDRLDGGRGYDDLCDIFCDTFRGGPGDDVLVAHDTPSSLDGGLGRDRLTGGSRDDFANGGLGQDVVLAGRGDDTIHVKDGARDVVSCGRGSDAVAADRTDRIARDCEFTLRR